jgi:GT2 family glycosyltransferase
MASLDRQTYRNFETIVVTDDGPLATIRNAGARRSRGKYFIFIDDDVSCEPGWCNAIIQTFREKKDVGGVSGPSRISSESRQSRDIFRYKFFRKIYDLFLGRAGRNTPGYISKAGAWSLAACEEGCNYEGPVMYLEACNMAFRRSAFEKVGGFDEIYNGVGDFSEPDLCYRIRQRGYALWFSPRAKLHHEPSQVGAYGKRERDSQNRLQNYFTFSRRWVKPSCEHELFKLFIRGYYAFKTLKR